jgi:acetyl esterase
MAGKFELKKAKDGQFYFNLKGANGQVILTSEMYKAKSGAENSIESVKKNAALDERYDRRESKKGEPYFVLLAANKQVIRQSEMYSSAAAMEKGINSVKTNAPAASVDDLTSEVMKHVAPTLQKWLDDFNQLLEDLLKQGFKQNPTNAREGLANLTRNLVTDIPKVAWVQDDVVNAPQYAIPVRIYHPTPDTSLPVLIYYHGGGHMAGSVTVYDPICRKLSLAANHIVVSVDYRLAPECPYPAAVIDACNVAKNIWPTLEGRNLMYLKQLSIAGDSGGGALCATVAHLLQHDAGIDIKRQTLIYPSLDYTMNTDSIDENATGYLLHKEKIIWYFDNYFQNYENRKAASPLYMEFSRKLPETLVITAQFCPLRDEGLAYVKKAQSAGIHAQNLHFDDMIHTFLNMEELAKEACQSVYQKIGEFLNR